MDVMLAAERGDLKNPGYYYKRWNWSRTRAYDNFKLLQEKARNWRGFTTDTRRTVSGRWTDKIPAKHSGNGAQPDTRRTLDGHSTDSIDRSLKYNYDSILESSSTEPTKDSECDSNNDIEKPRRLATNKEVMDSWNAFAARNGLATIKTINPQRARWIRLRVNKIWPVLDEIYAGILREPFLMGHVKDWRVGFDYVWRNGSNYTKILEGGHWGNGSAASKAVAPKRRTEPMYKPWKPADSNSDFESLFR